MSFLDGKSVLISGSTGMIGSQIIKKIVLDNTAQKIKTKIIALYRNEKKRKEVFSDISNDKDIKWIQCDINKPLEDMGQIDYIIHTAGVTGGSKKHVTFPMDTINTAINGTINLLELARKSAVKGFVYLSSLEIYGKTGFDIPSIKETDGGYIDSMAVRSSYSESKRMCETICSSYCKQYDVPAKVVRLTATYGTGASYEDNRVLCEFARCIVEKKDIVLHSYGDTIRNYCDVSDAVNAILLVLEKGDVGTAYNIANMSTEISIKELALRCIELYPKSNTTLNFDILDNITELGYNNVVKIRLDSTKLMALGWEPTVGINQIIKNVVQTYKMYRENG